MKLIVDLIFEGGLSNMNYSISETAEFGGYVSGPKIIDDHVKESMKKVLSEIQDSTFVDAMFKDVDAGQPGLKGLREEYANHPLEKAGKDMRSMMSWIANPLDETA